MSSSGSEQTKGKRVQLVNSSSSAEISDSPSLSIIATKISPGPARKRSRHPQKRPIYSAKDTDSDDEDNFLLNSTLPNSSNHQERNFSASKGLEFPKQVDEDWKQREEMERADMELARKLHAEEESLRDDLLAIEKLDRDIARQSLIDEDFIIIDDEVEIPSSNSSSRLSTRPDFKEHNIIDNEQYAQRLQNQGSFYQFLRPVARSIRVLNDDEELAHQMQLEESLIGSTITPTTSRTVANFNNMDSPARDILMQFLAEQEQINQVHNHEEVNNLFAETPIARLNRLNRQTNRVPRLNNNNRQIQQQPLQEFDEWRFGLQPVLMNHFGNRLGNRLWDEVPDTYESMIELAERLGPARSRGASNELLMTLPTYKYESAEEKSEKSC
ncbi:hypothetical protein HK096_008353, partial [Nowakowskiella sp. JEL0078]